MARSSKVDPVDKFRFRITVLAIDLSVTGGVETLLSTLPDQALPGKNRFKLVSRAGFQEVTLPKANVSEIPYRENIDNLRFSKIPGLVKYDPVVFRRGVTASRDLYEWYRLVNDELALLSVAQELHKDAKYSTTQSENFRRDVVIEVLDREGTSVKAWYLFNAWPISYKGGNDLNAQVEEKLVEELTLTYELMLELEGGIEGFGKEIAKGALTGAAGVLLKKLPFLR